MKVYRLARMAVVPAVWVWVAPLLLMGVAVAAYAEAEAGVEVLTRGPVHEAFAKASMTGASAGIAITKAAPDPIEELPPDQRPEGVNVAWIPGYWSWDDDRDNFIWVSGVWRDIPPERQWVPGYWAPVEGGYQWISGFWAEVAQKEVAYLPPPPEPVEAGPSSPAPGASSSWSAGCWVWQDTRYAWQPGYWVEQRPDWMWAPAHYTWTPSGYVFIPGYWDHDLMHRGVVFAPVYYSTPVYANPGYVYSPAIVIETALLATCLFVRPASHHYYFGDYYDVRYEARGIYPWHAKEVIRFGEDPMYVHYRAAQLRHDPDWDAHFAEQYRFRREHVDARPAATLALQASLAGKHGEGLVLGRSLAEAAQSKGQPLHFTRVNADERKQIQARGQEVNKFQLERRKLEAAPAASVKAEKGAEGPRAIRRQLPSSPVAARAIEKGKQGKTPPPIPTAPKAHAVKGEGPAKTRGKLETKTETPKLQEKSVRGEPKARKIEARPEAPKLQEKPGKAEPKLQARPEKLEAKPKTVAPKPETLKREITPGKVESKSLTPKGSGKIERKAEPKLEAKPRTPDVHKPESPKLEEKPKTPEVHKAEPKKLEVKPQQSKSTVKRGKPEDEKKKKKDEEH